MNMNHRWELRVWILCECQKMRICYGDVWFEFETCYLRLRIIVSVKLLYSNIQQKYIIILHSFALFYTVSMSIELY